MDTIQIKDKQFTVSIKEQDIQKEVIRVANEINRDLAGKNPLFLSVLNGSFMFTADLLKHITIPCEISFVKLASYQGVTSTGVIKEVIGLNEDIAGRTVVIVEDIVDTGLTMQRLLDTLGTRNPEAIHIASLLVKPESDVKTAPDDLVLCEANVYQMKEDDRFELVLMNSEWRHPEAVKQFMVRLRQEHRLEEISDVKKCVYHCDKSRGYFLAGRDYEVWSQLVGLVENTQGLSKKVLVVDYNCGIPCVVDFKEENFELVD